MTANISAPSVTVQNELTQFLWPGGRHVAAVADVAYEGWSDGKAPGIGPAGNPLPPALLIPTPDPGETTAPTTESTASFGFSNAPGCRPASW